MQRNIQICSSLTILLYSLFMIALTPGHSRTQDYTRYIGEVLITEFMAINKGVLVDRDGDESDWLELYNASPETVSLEGWYLTDSADTLPQWAFPEVQLQSGDYLVVFASGKDSTDPVTELHTNFKLNNGGEYLALVAPDGATIIHEYSPQYPDQNIPRENYSYGLVTKSDTFISANAPAKILVPGNGNLGTRWTQANFDDSSWITATLGIGYGSRQGRFEVKKIMANDEVSHIEIAINVINTPALQGRVVTETAPYINYVDSQGGGNFENNRPFPGSQISTAEDDFVIVAKTDLVIPRSGKWTFGVNSDDGCRLRIGDAIVIYDPDPHAPQDNFGTLDMEAGLYPLELIYYERGGGAELELFAAEGEHSRFNSNFKLIGDSKNGGLSLEGFASMIHTDVSSTMQGNNASIYTRIPFEITDISLQYNLRLHVLYNDGYVAYINGQEIGRSNAPETLSWDASSASARSGDLALEPEILRITTTPGMLHEGTNIVAFHALNASKEDDEFLLSASMDGSALQGSNQRYFSQPTPGERNVGGVIGFVDDPHFSVPRGFYDSPFAVEIVCNTEGSEIRYSLDGSTPTETTGMVYTGPIPITTTTILRAAAFKKDHDSSNVDTQTYLFLADVLKQPNRPAGFPTTWASGVSADYEMDPDVVNHALYRDEMIDNLKSIPTLSLVSDQDNLFGRARGIYTHPESKGVQWERPASAELIYPDGRQGFQANHGLRIQGGYSRVPSQRKHSFRLLFKRQYGSAKLEYPIFGDDAVDQFDNIVLRGYYNYSWHAGEGGFGSSIGRADYCRDEFSRRLQLASGHPSAHGTYFHVYLNGLYWGIYNACERPDDGFTSDYMGGDKKDWDIVTSGTRGIDQPQVKAGNKDAWNQIFQMIESLNFRNQENYEQIKEWVDLDNIINYMLVIYYTGNRDAPTVIGGGGRPWNFYTGRKRAPGEGLKAFCWDSEWTLEEPDRNVVTFHNGFQNPARILQRLKVNDEFKILLADHIQRTFFNDGPFTVENASTLYREISDTIYQAIVCESARWGDMRSGTPKTRNSHWIPERNRILETYLPVRTNTVLKQLIDADLFPSISAPAFNQHGGVVDKGFSLTMQSEPITGDIPMIKTDILNFTDEWKYYQDGSRDSVHWQSESFNDGAWPSGKGLLYVENAALPQPKNTSLTLGRPTYYFRNTFTLPANFNFEKAFVEFNTLIDDGAVFYINGEEFFRLRMPTGDITYNTFASATVGDAALEGAFSIPVSKLHVGKNTIAVEVHQSNANSSDVVFGLELYSMMEDTTNPDEVTIPIYFTTDGSDPRLEGGAINHNSAIAYTDNVSIDRDVIINARAYQNGVWSAVNKAEFFIDTPASVNDILRQSLRITELMYHPAESEEFEFIEFHNSDTTQSLPLSNIAFSEGISYVFPVGTSLAPGGYLLLIPGATADEVESFRTHYNLDATVPIYGPYAGRLSNSGEKIELINATNNERIIAFTFSDNRGWPLEADGAGHSLVPVGDGLVNQDQGSLDYGGNWRASAFIKGSPGQADPQPMRTVVLNEVMANTNTPSITRGNDWVELYNTGNATISLDRWYLSDDINNLKQWAIPDIEIAAGAWLSFDEVSGFNNPAGTGFALSKDGEQLFLSYLPGLNGVDRVIDAIRFKAQTPALSYGRYEDGAAYLYHTVPSRGAMNSQSIMSAVIEEIMYAPQLMDDDNTTNLEYIEIYNPHSGPIALWNEDGAWRLDGGIAYTFPPQVSIPGKRCIVVVGFDPMDPMVRTEFLSAYGLDHNEVVLYGPYDGKLSNQGEKIALEQPQALSEGSEDVAWVIVDEVIYFTQAPWTPEAHGTGHSLQRIRAEISGNHPGNWKAAAPNLGQADLVTPIPDWMLY
jgi:hypothetical protein